jgi:hypothetical protein
MRTLGPALRGSFLVLAGFDRQWPDLKTAVAAHNRERSEITFFVIPFPKTIGAVMADRAGLKNLNKTISGVSA